MRVIEFSDDHPVPALRGYPHPKWSRVKRARAQRCVWLDQKIGQRTATGGEANLLIEELASLVWLVEEVERRRATDVASTLGSVPWRRGPPPRGVRCLVTTRDAAARRDLTCASVSLDHEDTAWFSDGARLHHVVAWMLAPEPAGDEESP